MFFCVNFMLRDLTYASVTGCTKDAPLNYPRLKSLGAAMSLYFPTTEDTCRAAGSRATHAQIAIVANSRFTTSDLRLDRMKHCSNTGKRSSVDLSKIELHTLRLTSPFRHLFFFRTINVCTSSSELQTVDSGDH